MPCSPCNCKTPFPKSISFISQECPSLLNITPGLNQSKPKRQEAKNGNLYHVGHMQSLMPRSNNHKASSFMSRVARVHRIPHSANVKRSQLGLRFLHDTAQPTMEISLKMRVSQVRRHPGISDTVPNLPFSMQTKVSSGG